MTAGIEINNARGDVAPRGGRTIYFFDPNHHLIEIRTYAESALPAPVSHKH